jgi:tRNA(adenine34) deaminase
MENSNDIKWMRKALQLAASAAEQDEVPVGAILVKDNRMIARAFNKKEQWNSPLGHAELICLERASKKLGQWRLSGCTLYVTLEPCLMCAGGILQARVDRVVFGARDPKAGAVESLYQVLNDSRLNHRVEISSGILGDECGGILSEFFRKKRAEKQIRK